MDRIQGMRPGSPTFIIGWVAACAAAAALGASLSHVALAPGPPRLIADGFIVGLLQGFALRGLVRLRYWVALTMSGIPLGFIAAVMAVVVAGFGLTPLGTETPVSLAIIYGAGALVGGLVVGFIQSVGLPRERRLAPWLVGSACGAPFIFPALVVSWLPPESVATPVPPLLIGLVGGLAYGVVSAFGLQRAVNVVGGSSPR